MKRVSISKKIIIFIVFILFAVTNKTYGFYTENVLKELSYTQEYLEWMDLSEEQKSVTLMPRKYYIDTYYKNINSRTINLRTSLLTSKLMISNLESYDLRDDIVVKVRNQGNTGQCWAFAVNTAIQSNIEKTTNQVSDIFSPRYVEYATSKNFLDGTNPIAYNREVGDGGFAEIALGLYTSGNGPMLEEEFPFENNQNQINLSEIQNLETQKQIKEYIRFDGIYKNYENGTVKYTDINGNSYTDEQVLEIRNEIKEHIMNYGAVISQTYGIGGNSIDAKEYYNNKNIFEATAYFCNNPSLTEDHQITIIGWDDNYEVSNFNSNYIPSSPGAYIVLNSWGETFGDNGIYYISYEDCFIEKNVLGIVRTSDIEYDTIYQYDELGNNYMVSSNKDIYGANVFERKDISQNEWLTQISISSLLDIKCDIYVKSESGELNSENLTLVATNIEIKNGYNTIDLDTPLHLTGDKFAVIVKYITDEQGFAYFGLEYPDEYYWTTATAQKGQSYLSLDLENWDDIVNMGTNTIVPKNANLCIKAFTINKETNSEYFIINNYSSNSEYIYNISPKTKLSEFSNNIYTNMEYYVYDIDSNVVENEQLISTGMKLKTNNNVYTIVVKGDLDGNGKLTITDLVKAKLHLSNIVTLKNEFKKALDINNDGKITITDLVIINLANVNIKNI